MKTFTPEGMATRKVRPLNTIVAYSLMPAVNMWWPHTRKPSSASEMELIATNM